MTTKLGFWPSASEAFALAARASSLVAMTSPKRRASSTIAADTRANAPPRQDWVLRSGIFIELQGHYAPREEKPPSDDGVALRKVKVAQDAPSLAAASRKFLTVAEGALRPSSFSPCRFTQITGTFIFRTGAMSVV